MAAATGAAVFGGWLGHRLGSLWYEDRTKQHFQTLKDAQAEIEGLEAGAKVRFPYKSLIVTAHWGPEQP